MQPNVCMLGITSGCRRTISKPWSSGSANCLAGESSSLILVFSSLVTSFVKVRIMLVLLGMSVKETKTIILKLFEVFIE